ncbi:hypothetical protein NE237_029403 [Protea cynaroides]|uniref:Uncharacterized protein n=1 Tax=Protea cynaroides TaxID=273540 RepID=A0A9Q0GT28_9MAGN|nr:hypothetical protein NE237_014256 [Protea cynaroides]KAJ4952571.1 hypothetical protein NE237_029403 [Protea cynaroides]
MVQKDKGGGFISGRISLCSSSYKIMDKVLSLRMEIIPFIIASAQGGFVKGHQIHDGILLAHERSSMLSLKVVLQESFSSVTCGSAAEAKQAGVGTISTASSVPAPVSWSTESTTSAGYTATASTDFNFSCDCY